MNKEYKIDKDYIQLLIDNKDKIIHLGENDIRILITYIDVLQQELQRKDNEINNLKSSINDYQEAVGDYQDELKESINNFDVFKEFTFPLMKRDEEQQVISSIDYEWRKSIKEPFLNKIEELETGRSDE